MCRSESFFFLETATDRETTQFPSSPLRLSGIICRSTGKRLPQVTGKGYEDVNDIGRDVCTLGFMGIENIHAVRDSLAAFCSASQAQGQDYYHAVGASGWLRHLSQVWCALIAETVWRFSAAAAAAVSSKSQA